MCEEQPSPFLIWKLLCEDVMLEATAAIWGLKTTYLKNKCNKWWQRRRMEQAWVLAELVELGSPPPNTLWLTCYRQDIL